MSFVSNYTPGATQPPNSQTPLFGAKSVQCKSFKIDIAAGNPFLTATTYTVGYLPKDAQFVEGALWVPTSVSGGTVSAATLAIAVGGSNVGTGLNVFTTGKITLASTSYYGTVVAGGGATADQAVTYTPTLTGAGATAGIIYVNILYVI